MTAAEILKSYWNEQNLYRLLLGCIPSFFPPTTTAAQQESYKDPTESTSPGQGGSCISQNVWEDRRDASCQQLPGRSQEDVQPNSSGKDWGEGIGFQRFIV
ncbi:hypothetical protein DFP72DRAFT_1178139 [Ephemerocybe angulata]|uniref:Uncharacterized protein n=1 Tax=Ephemerocybe angulata TaxID=980116 RepID=A0A8H6LWI3_9AGAR|nr:hypothetical protein DFP72DRAFT_1178139 [Tulosesus angulatus]